MNIAIITARSGSKGLKNKNIKLLNGKPLMAYTIEEAIKSKCFDIVFVSTDSKKYADIAKEHGAEVPFLRSEKNAGDHSSSWDVIRETLKRYKEIGKEFDTFMLLQPTSPFRKAKDIKKAYKLLKENKANAIVSLCESEKLPQNLYKLSKNNLELSKSIDNKKVNKLRQDEKYYHFNGAIYLSKVDTFLKYGSIYKSKCYGYLMNKKSSLDIDDKIDFQFAELLIRREYN